MHTFIYLRISDFRNVQTYVFIDKFHYRLLIKSCKEIIDKFIKLNQKSKHSLKKLINL